MGWRSRFVLFALVTLVAAACGGASTDDTAAPSPTEVPSPTETSPGASPVGDGGVSDVDVTIVSDDGILQVLIPAGSGPANVTIEPIDMSDAEVQAVGYKLGPDGATFSEPVTLTFSLPASDWNAGDGVPLVQLASDSEDVPPATLSRDGDTVTVTADVGHFSSYYLFSLNGAVELRPGELWVFEGGHTESRVIASGHGQVIEGVDPISAKWSVPQGFTASMETTYFGVDPGFGEEVPIAEAWVTCESGSQGGPLGVELEVTFVFDRDELFGTPSSTVRVDGIVECGSTVPPEDVRVTGDVPDGMIDITGAALTAAGGSLDLVFSTDAAEGTTATDAPIVLILEAERPDGNQIIFQCPNAVTGGCLFFEGPSFFTFTAASTTQFPAPGDPLTFTTVDLAFGPNGVLSLVVPTITEQRDDSTIEPGMYPLTSIGVFTQIDDSSYKEWFWNPDDVASTLTD